MLVEYVVGRSLKNGVYTFLFCQYKVSKNMSFKSEEIDKSNDRNRVLHPFYGSSFV